MSVPERLRRAGAALIRLLYPAKAVCMGCGTEAGFDRDWLCEDCRRELAARAVGAFRDKKLDGAAAAFAYAGPAGGVVRAFKYNGVRAMASFMAEDMAVAYRTIQPTDAAVIVPVPMHPRRERRRGGNHARLLAEALSPLLGLPCRDALVRVRNTPQQARLGAQERRGNLKGAFAATGVEGLGVLLIDDVYTTGETARECAKALRKAGARSVWFLCYARGG